MDGFTISGRTTPALLYPPTSPAPGLGNTWTCTTCVVTINIFHRDSHLLTRSHTRKSCPSPSLSTSTTTTTTTPAPSQSDLWHCAPCDEKMHILHQATHLASKRHAQNLVRPVASAEQRELFLCGTCRAEVPAGELMGHLTTAELWACGVCARVVHLAWREQHLVGCVQVTWDAAGYGSLLEVEVEGLSGRLDSRELTDHSSEMSGQASGEQYVCPSCAKMVSLDHDCEVVQCPLCGVRTNKRYEASHHVTTRHRKAEELRLREEQAEQERKEMKEEERLAIKEEERKEREQMERTESELKQKKEREERQKQRQQRELEKKQQEERNERLRVQLQQQEREKEQIRNLELLRIEQESRRQEEIAQQARRKLEEAVKKAKIERLADVEKRERYLASLQKQLEETRKLEQQDKVQEQQRRQAAAEVEPHKIGEVSPAKIRKEWTCTVCDRTMPTVSKDEHLGGVKHQKKEHQKQEQGSRELELQKQDEEERHRKLERQKQEEERSRLVAKTPGIHGKHTWDCGVCERTMSVMAKPSHLAGKKHRNLELLQEQKERSLIESEIGAGNLGVNLR